MERTFESGRHAVTFRADGWMRFVSAAFLGVWLCGWAMGEAFAGTALAWMLWQLLLPGRPFPFQGIPHVATPPPPAAWFMIAFLVFWLAVWTIAGLGAMYVMLRSMWGSDRIEWDGGVLRRIARAGPLARAHEWPASEVSALVLGRRGCGLGVLARGRTEELTGFGTADERRALRDEIAAALGLHRADQSREIALPPGWEVSPDPAGGMRLEPPAAGRVRASAFVWAIALALGVAAAFGPITESHGLWTAHAITSTIVLALLALAAVAGASWLGAGRSYYRLRSRSLERCWRLGEREWTMSFRAAAVRVTHRLDSDRDEWFALEVLDGEKWRGVQSTLKDPEPVLKLGRWLAARLECPFEAAPGVEDDARVA